MTTPLAGPASPAASPYTKRTTIERVLQAAREAFARKGVAATRVDDIAREAGVTKQLVYHYFATKEHLFTCVLDASIDRIVATLMALEIDHLPPREGLRVLLGHVLDLYCTDPAMGALAQQGLSYREAHANEDSRFPAVAPVLTLQVQRLLERGIASGDFRPDVDTRLFYAAASLLATGGFINRYMVSAVAGFDTASPAGIEGWRAFSVNFVLSALVNGERPSLQRPDPA